MRARLLHEVLPVASGDEAILEVEDLHLSFAGVRAVVGVSFTVRNGQLFAIIGPNGAGKTSIFNCISGVYVPQQGSIRFLGRDLLGMKPHRIADMGVARTFQNIELFPQMTVLDNLMLGRHQHLRYGTAAAMLRIGRASRQEAENREVVEAIIEFLGIESRRSLSPISGDVRIEWLGKPARGRVPFLDASEVTASAPRAAAAVGSGSTSKCSFIVTSASSVTPLPGTTRCVGKTTRPGSRVGTMSDSVRAAAGFSCR